MDIWGSLTKRKKSYAKLSQRSEFTMLGTLVLVPNVISGEIDVFPTMTW
jgi:hypothetical protein